MLNFVYSLKQWMVGEFLVDSLFAYRVFSHDVTAAILVAQNNETAAILVSLFLCKRFLLFQ